MNELAMAKRCAQQMWAGDKASKALGIKIEIRAVGAATAKMQVRDDMVNGFDVCHGGMLFALADTAFAFACNAYNRVTFAASAQQAASDSLDEVRRLDQVPGRGQSGQSPERLGGIARLEAPFALEA